MWSVGVSLYRKLASSPVIRSTGTSSPGGASIAPMINRTAVDALLERVHREIDEGIVPSCQLAIAENGKVVESVTLGDPVAGNDTRYVIFSCTKAPVASAIWQVLAEGAIRLED